MQNLPKMHGTSEHCGRPHGNGNDKGEITSVDAHVEEKIENYRQILGAEQNENARDAKKR